MKGSVLVTGGSKGIGLAIAERFLAEGYSVTVCARGTTALSELACRRLAVDAVVCDMTNRDDVDRLVEHVTRRHGVLDVLVNNSGHYLPGQIHDEPEGNLLAMLESNLLGAYRLSRRLLPGMIERGRGTIINVCSTASVVAYPNGGSYCIAKHALYGFSRTLREELKPHGIRVVTLLPGATLTASWAGTDLPPERFMPAEDVAEMAWVAHKLSPRTVVEEIVMRPQLGDLG
jgi:NAD(P)-dependent dehydrogenase (short-subunit alcohol dehydrogenase family)